MLVALALACAPSAGLDAAEPPLVVLAAASLTDALPEVAHAWRAEGGAEVELAFDASGRLARQVLAGAPADVLITADEESLDLAAPALRAGTRRTLLGNSLVLVVPAGAAWAPASPAELDAPGLRHLALAGEQVPAGRYARAALASAGVAEALAPRVVSADHVRTALAWVARGEADAGVVYASDAQGEPAVRAAFRFPDGSHPPVRLPGAVTAAADRPEEAAAFLAFCGSEEATRIFLDAGFTLP